MDRDFILKQAKKILLKRGEHAPLLFCATEEQPYILPIISDGWNTDNFGRVKTLFLMGREFAQSECITPELITACYLVHEFWYVMRKVGEELPDQPSKCADRKEALGILELKINQKDRSVALAFVHSDILRNGNVIDLGSCEERDSTQSNLLTSFLSGVASAKYDEEEFAKVIERFAEVGEI